jgi:hypothetical protein
MTCPHDGDSGMDAFLEPRKEISFESPLNKNDMEELRKNGLVAAMVFYGPSLGTTLAWSNKIQEP